jgi:hypothetical protein
VPAFPEALLFHYLDDMDSKMECMRALLGKEPQAEGLFTPWSAALERIALRKDRYLAGAPAKTAPEALPAVPPVTMPAAAETPAQEPSAGDANAAAAGAAASNGLSPASPGRAPVAQPKPKPAPASNSIFGEKLQQALNDERK